jgi:multiple sugar transport system substrate-binding protein
VTAALRHRPLRAAAVLALAALVAAACGGSGGGASSSGSGPVLHLTIDRDPTDTIPGQIERCNEQADGRWQVRPILMPQTVDAKREQLSRRLAAQDPGLDLITIDVVWTAEFSEAGWIIDLSERIEPLRDRYVPAALATAEYGGSIWAAPVNTNVAMLYYRTDLIDQPPGTWAELKELALRMVAEHDVAGFIFQGQQYEGLTVDAMEFMTSFGGSVLDESGGKVVLTDGPEALEGLTFMRSLLESGATPRIIATFTEEESRYAFQNGDAAMLRNWPYVYGLMSTGTSKVIDKFDVAPLPGRNPGEATGVLGGANVALSAYSRHPELAWEALECLTGPDYQRAMATSRNELPTLQELYDDPEVQAAQPYLAVARTALDTAHPRPVSPYYPDVTIAISRAANAVVTGGLTPEQAIERMQDHIQRAIDGKPVI